jgi:dTDP-4-dehydrorhamnose 3,5-epimerase
MRFIPLGLAGAWIMEPEQLSDERGFFARVWCASELEQHGLISTLSQASIAFSLKAGTLRGLHFQRPPHAEVKIVRCTRGSIYDVIVDLRPQSPTHLQWTHVVLSAENRRILYVPEGFAHGYQTLEDETEVFYQMSTPYTPGAEAGLAWNDPTLAIIWPEVAERIVSAKDRAAPLLSVDRAGAMADARGGRG